MDAGAVRIPDHPVLLRELRLLERSPARLQGAGGAPARLHDDLCQRLLRRALRPGQLSRRFGAYAEALARATADDVPEPRAVRGRSSNASAATTS